MKYRREIDGLRAIAVLPVLFFHAGLNAFSGGYVGVDIFFVISGYLITSIILREKSRGSFSILHFYERRVRRILPALFVVMLFCIPPAWLWMLPAQFIEFAHSLVAVPLFSSNFLFWNESGYFALAAEEKPLLHTWSLAVEEQFYLLFPLFIVLFLRFGKRALFYLILVCAICSLLVSEYGWRYHPSVNFYLAPSRAWELLAGSLCAFTLFERRPQKSNAAASVGLLIIFIAIFYFDRNTPFPSLYALLPTVGTALLILFCTPDTLVGKMLASKPLVGTGLISYSTYLWHQPLLAFARVRSPTMPTDGFMIFLCIFSLLLGYLSWRYVEQPFRSKKKVLFQSRAQLFSVAVVGSLFFVFAGVIGHINQGFRGRIPAVGLAAVDVANYSHPINEYCHLDGSDHPSHPVAECLFNSDAPKKIVMVGDSHANSVYAFLGEFLSPYEVSFYGTSYSGCVPIAGFDRIGLAAYHQCHEFNEGIFSYLEKIKPDVVILLSRWTTYYRGDLFDNGEGGREVGGAVHIDLHNRSGLDSSVESAERKHRVLSGYQSGVERYLALGANVILIYPVPEAGWHVPHLLSKRVMQGGSYKNLSTQYSFFTERNKEVISLFDTIEHPGLYRVKPHEILCDTFIAGRCANSIGDRIFYTDEDHLSREGAQLIIEEVREILEELNLLSEDSIKARSGS